jgi:hypothetical protein
MTNAVRRAEGATEKVSVPPKGYKDMLRHGKISDSDSTTVTVNMALDEAEVRA